VLKSFWRACRPFWRNRQICVLLQPNVLKLAGLRNSQLFPLPVGTCISPAINHMQRRRQRSKNNVAAKSSTRLVGILFLFLCFFLFFVPTTAMWQIHKFAKNVAAFQKIWAGNLKLLCAGPTSSCVLRPAAFKVKSHKSNKNGKCEEGSRLSLARLIFKHLIYTRPGDFDCIQKKNRGLKKGYQMFSLFISQISCCPSAGSSFFISPNIKLSQEE